MALGRPRLLILMGALVVLVMSQATARATTSHHPFPDGDWTRFNFDAQRSGVGPADTGITAANVDRLRVRLVQLDGTVDASAIQLHNVKVHRRRRDVVIMTTTYGRTIELDPRTGHRLWEFTPPDIGRYQGTFQITTTTPVADPDRRYVYAASPDGYIHKLRVATGRQVRSRHWPVRVTFDPTHEKLASALNISGRSLVVTTDGYMGDAPPYQGHVVFINRRTGRITAVWNALCSNRHHLIHPSSCSASDAAIWGRSGAVIEPGSHRILVATGNAPFNGSTEWGDSVLELSASAHRLLHNWTPTNQAELNSDDLDVGSTSPAVLPEYHGFRLAVQGGKAEVLDLLDLGRLNGTTGGPGPRTGGQLQQLPTPGAAMMFTEPAVWTSGGQTYVFVATGGGTDAYVLTGGNQPRLTVAWHNHVAGSSPVLAGGLLYVYNPNAGALNVYDPTSGNQLVSLPAASGHWNSPIVVGGRVILPTGDANDHSLKGSAYIFHLPGR